MDSTKEQIGVQAQEDNSHETKQVVNTEQSDKLEDDYFDAYHTTIDIKLQMLSYLDIRSIFVSMTAVSFEWNYTCISAFNHPLFCKIDFFYKAVRTICEKSRGRDREILVECPWNYLWTKGKTYSNIIFRRHEAGLRVNVTTTYYNPFANNTIVAADTDYKINIENKDKDNDDTIQQQLQQETKCLTFESCYKFVAPLNTLEKIENDVINGVDIKTMFDKTKKHCFLSTNNNKSQMKKVRIDNKESEKNKQQDEKNNDQKVDASSQDSEISSKFKQSLEFEDYFGRPLVDCIIPKELNLWSFERLHKNATGQVIPPPRPVKKIKWGEGMSYQDRWTCGIVDYGALDVYFPNWQETNRYQVPVLIDVTHLLTHDKELTINTRFHRQFCNIFEYAANNDNDNNNTNGIKNNNRYFTRIWYNSFRFHSTIIDSSRINDTIYRGPSIAPFASKSTENERLKLLGTPVILLHDYDALRKNIQTMENMENEKKKDSANIDDDGADDDNKEKEIPPKTTKMEVENLIIGENIESINSFDFVTSSQLSMKSIVDDYLIKLQHSSYDDFDALSRKYHYNYNGLCLRNFNGKLLRIYLVQSKESGKYEMFIKHWNNKTTKAPIMLNDNIIVKTKEKNTNHFYRTSIIYNRPRMISFNADIGFNAQFTAMNSSRWVLHRQNCLYVDVKPLHIALPCDKGSLWNDKWSQDRIKKELNMNGNELIFGNFFPNYYCVISELTFKQREWKVGQIKYQSKERLVSYLYNKENLQQNGDDTKNNSNNNKKKINFNRNGQIPILIDITKEFDQFQNKLKQDWINAMMKEKDETQLQSEWNNRKYFMNCIKRDKISQGEERIMFQYWAHLDNTHEIAPCRTYTKNSKEKPDIGLYALHLKKLNNV